jgi:ribonucleoside-diphosphate reductase alpha chain
MQKFVDQAISANTNYDPARFPGGKVSTEVLLRDLIIAYKFGWKTLYYHNTRDGSDDKTFEEKVEVVLPTPGDDDCSDGCKI